MPKEAQLERLKKVNELISFIAEVDDEISGNENGIMFKVMCNDVCHGTAKFKFIRKRLYYIDQTCIYPYSNTDYGKWLSGDKVLWALINDMREYIITGKQSNGNNGYYGLYYPDWGERWTPKSRDRIIEKAKELGYISNSNPTYHEFFNDFFSKLPQSIAN